MIKAQHITGGVQLKSNLSIEQLGSLISERVLGGIPLSGLEKKVYEEIPAIYNECMGLSLVLQGFSGMQHEWGFVFSLVPSFNSGSNETVDLSDYLFSLFQNKFSGEPDVIIIDPQELTK